MTRPLVPGPASVVAGIRAVADQARLGLVEVVLVWASVVALALGVVWGLLVGVDALSSGSDPDCPPTGCYAAWTPPAVWLVALGVAALTAWGLPRLVRARGAGVLLPGLLIAAVVQWGAMLAAIAVGLRD